MTLLPLHRVQCDRCRTVHVLAGKNSDYWGEELQDLGWIARPVRGKYQHACRLCADELIAEIKRRHA